MKEIIIHDGDIEIFISNRNQKTLDGKDIYILNYDNITNEIEYICKETNEYENLKLDPKELYVYNNLYEQAKYYKKKYGKNQKNYNIDSSYYNTCITYYKNDSKYIFFNYLKFCSEKSIIIKMDRSQFVKNKKNKIYIQGYNKLNNKLVFEENNEIKEVDFEELVYSEQLLKRAKDYYKRKYTFLNDNDEPDCKRVKGEIYSDSDSDLGYNTKKKLLRKNNDKYNNCYLENDNNEYCNIYGELYSNKNFNRELQIDKFNSKSFNNNKLNGELDYKDNNQESFNQNLENKNKKKFNINLKYQESFNRELDDKNKYTPNRELKYKDRARLLASSSEYNENENQKIFNGELKYQKPFNEYILNREFEYKSNENKNKKISNRELDDKNEESKNNNQELFSKIDEKDKN
jgi:hypothetical protein